EVDVSIRPGWFYHAKEDSLVKSPEKLFDIYLTSVGRGSTLLLNVPPDPRGLIHEIDARVLRAWRALLDSEFATNLAANARVEASSYRGDSDTFAPGNVTDGDKQSYWATDDRVTTGSLEIDLGETFTVKYVVIQEFIQLGQRVKRFSVEVFNGNAWKKVADGTTIGYKRILKLDPVQASRVRVNIEDAKACVVVSGVEVY